VLSCKSTAGKKANIAENQQSHVGVNLHAEGKAISVGLPWLIEGK